MKGLLHFSEILGSFETEDVMGFVRKNEKRDNYLREKNMCN